MQDFPWLERPSQSARLLREIPDTHSLAEIGFPRRHGFNPLWPGRFKSPGNLVCGEPWRDS